MLPIDMTNEMRPIQDGEIIGTHIPDMYISGFEYDRSTSQRDYSVQSLGGRMKAPAHRGDVGHNLPAIDEHKIRPGEFRFVPTGVKLAMPEGIWGMVLARSGTNFGGKLVNLAGVIDTGYRGELGVMVHNVYRPSILEWVLWVLRWLLVSSWVGGNDMPGTVHIKKDQSLAQMVFFQAVLPPVMAVEELPSSDRGENRFGSTGHS